MTTTSPTPQAFEPQIEINVAVRLYRDAAGAWRAEVRATGGGDPYGHTMIIARLDDADTAAQAVAASSDRIGALCSQVIAGQAAPPAAQEEPERPC